MISITVEKLVYSAVISSAEGLEGNERKKTNDAKHKYVFVFIMQLSA